MTNVEARAPNVMRPTDTALLKRDERAFDALCASYFQGRLPALLHALDEERPDASCPLPSRFVLDTRGLREDRASMIASLVEAQDDEDTHPVHVISRALTPDALIGFFRIDVYGPEGDDFLGHQAELYVTLAREGDDVKVGHAWLNNYDGDDDYASVEEHENFEGLDV